MAKLIKQLSNGGHWYTPDGHPRHRIESADGEFRNTTLRDARKLGLMPSVTGILNCIDKPALGDWRLRQVVDACAAVGLAGEVTDQTFREIKDRAFAQVADAADLGSKIHAAVENYLLTGEAPAGDLLIYLDPVIEFLKTVNITPIEVEKILVSKLHGYAGTVDLLFKWGEGDSKLGILDWKTRRTRKGQKVKAYDGQDLQLAAYAAAAYGADQLGEVMAANIVISTTEPGRMDVLRHNDLRASWEAFQAVAATWRHIKSYDPRIPLTYENAKAGII